MPAQKVTVIDYRKANAANSLLPKPSILSSSGWSNLHLEVYQQRGEDLKTGLILLGPIVGVALIGATGIINAFFVNAITFFAFCNYFGDRYLPIPIEIQAEREPEIIRVQQLQSQEAAQAELLGKSALLRSLVSQLAPLVRQPIRYSWLRRQHQLRRGVAPIKLMV